jgi:hypothetical protein
MSHKYMNSLYGGARPPTPIPEDIDDFIQDDETMNDNPSDIPFVNPEFANKLTDTKRLIYSAVIFANNENTDEAQDTNILNDYVRMLGALYDTLSRMESNTITQGEREQNIDVLPQGARSSANDVIVLYDAFLTQNRDAEKRVPYSSYIENSLKRHPYVQEKELG